jgi:hypothetical protein
MHHFEGESCYVLVAQNIINNYLLKKAITAVLYYVAITSHAQFR